MTSATETIVINGTKEAAEAIRNEIDMQAGSQSHLTERRNLDGGATLWILAGELTKQALPHILGFIKDHLPSGRVTKITVGDWVVENPTPEIIELFLARMAAQVKSEETMGKSDV